MHIMKQPIETYSILYCISIARFKYFGRYRTEEVVTPFSRKDEVIANLELSVRIRFNAVISVDSQVVLLAGLIGKHIPKNYTNHHSCSKHMYMIHLTII